MEGSVAENLTDYSGGTLAVVEPNEKTKNLLGIDELNFAEFPLAACGYKVDPNQKTLIFEDTIFDEGQRTPVKRKLIIAASDAWGLPTPVDSDVLLVLMHLTRVRNGFTSRQVTFSRYELIQLLGWNDGGRSYQRLEQSLQRWTSVTLSYNKAWWDRTSQVWRTRTFHVIESLDLRGRVGSHLDDQPSTFTWNEVLFGSFQANNIKRLDLSIYFQLELPVARQMYRFLDKRFYRTARLELDLKYFGCEHVGLSRNYDNSQLQRRLLPAIQELESIGFLVPLKKNERFVQVRRGEWKIVLLANRGFSKTGKAVRPTPTSDLRAKLCDQMIERGVSRKAASDLVAKYPESLIASQIEMHDNLVKSGDSRVAKNSAGFLVASIRDNYQSTGKPIEKTKSKSHQPVLTTRPKTAKEIQMEKLQAEQDAALDQYLASLTPEQAQELEEAALINGTRMQIESYYRLRPNGGVLFESLRRQLIRDHRQSTKLM